MLLIMAVGAYKYAKSTSSYQWFRDSYRSQIYAWFILVLILFWFGIAHGNDLLTVGKELIALLTMGIFLFVGGDERFWYGVEKHLTIIFYVGVVLTLLYYNTPAVSISKSDVGQDFSARMNFRYTNSLAMALRPLTGMGLMLGMWGLVSSGGGVWRVVQSFAFAALFWCDVGLFKFRNVATTLLIALLCYLLLRPILEKRTRNPVIGVLVVCLSLIALRSYIATDSGQAMQKRVLVETEREGITTSRTEELERYWEEMHLEVLVGRGLGGAFDASGLYSDNELADRWPTLHFGVLLFTLKGGVLFLALFVSFVIPGFIWHDRFWYRSPCDLTAALLFPAYCVALALDPIPLTPEWTLSLLPIMMVLARSSRRENWRNPRAQWVKSALRPMRRILVGGRGHSAGHIEAWRAKAM
ncbi:MAG: hypothetical protein ABR991_13870 [Terracidiphilus sp.]